METATNYISPNEDFLTDSSTTGFFDGLKNVSMTTWLLIILIFSFLGFNIFVYLAKGTQDITNILDPLLSKIFGTTISVAGQAIDVSAEGAKSVVNTTASVIDTGLTSIQNITPNATPSINKGQPVTQQQTQPNLQQTSLNKALSSTETQSEYQANESSSSVHSSGKAGWCYIGMDREFRTCGEVGVNDTCMSGDIFPSHEICVNPNLRA